MKLRAKTATWLLPFLLTACGPKPQPLPPQAYAPPVSKLPKPQTTHPDLPESAIVLATEPVDEDTDPIVDEAARPVPRRKKPVPAKATSDGPEAVTQTANSNPPPPPAPSESSPGAVSAMGDLSSGDPADLRRETSNSITDTEIGLKSLDHPLNGQEEKTVEQIRQFIRQARKALASGDVDGAHTLASKAKVLLGELSQ
jgi:hypothetical protein